jgi:hypothetical protein
VNRRVVGNFPIFQCGKIKRDSEFKQKGRGILIATLEFCLFYIPAINNWRKFRGSILNLTQYQSHLGDAPKHMYSACILDILISQLWGSLSRCIWGGKSPEILTPEDKQFIYINSQIADQ